jgi:phytoene desaturase
MNRAVIIGAGFSGLSAACFMAKAGWEVIVIEKNNTSGGRARQLKNSGFTFDMGPSWYWMPEVFERFFNSFNKKPTDYYSLKRIDPSYRIFWENGSTDIPAEYKLLQKVFEELEPGSELKLDKFLSNAKDKYDLAINKMIFKPGLSVFEYLNAEVIKSAFKLNVFSSVHYEISKSFANKKLQTIMEFPVLFLGGLPENTPALYSLMNYADIKGGTWYPRGGFYSVVQSMEKLAIELGVQFHFNEEVTSIEIEKSRIKYINSNKDTYKVDAVISAADYHHTESKLVKAQYKSYSDKYWNERALSPSSLIFYIGLNKKLNNVLHHNLFFDESFQNHAEQLYKKKEWPENPLFYLNVPSKSDNELAPEGCENLMILIPVASGLKDDNDNLRERYFQKIVRRIEKHSGEKISDAIIYKKSYSISDFSIDYNSFKGNAYGLANTLHQTAFLKPSCRSKKVNNLFYAGQLTVPGPGVPPCIISGEIVAKEVIKTIKA